MEGVKQAKPFWAISSIRRMCEFLVTNSPYLNPLRWPKRLVKVLTAAFFMIMLPIYLFIGLQPAPFADATSYPILEIPTINLKTPVASVELVDRQLAVPATIAGVYQPFPNKLFIIGHSSTVFQNLDQLQLGETFTYQDETYSVTDYEVIQKSAISMNELLSDAPEKTIIIMTCAGEPLPNQDATHRLIITATLAK